MNNIEDNVANHYGDSELLSRIFSGLQASGIDPKEMKVDDLAPVDEFHIGGRMATAHAVQKMALGTNQHILDVGCGIGGAARYIASLTGNNVTGIDLTPEYISTAIELTELIGLNERINYQVASALDMPFDDEIFDAAITIHVAMNIPDREKLYGEIARVMKPGAKLCIYDVMKKGNQAIVFPVPWATSSETSHLVSADEMKSLLSDAGFKINDVEDRTEPAIEFFERGIAASADGPVPLGMHLVMGESAPIKFKNIYDNVKNGRVAPTQIIAQRI